MHESFGVHHHLCDHLVVRFRHRDRAEEGFEVIGQLRAAAVALARRVHRDEDARVEVELVAREAGYLDGALAPLDRGLDDLDLLRDLGELVGLEAVELVEAPPRAAPGQGWG